MQVLLVNGSPSRRACTYSQLFKGKPAAAVASRYRAGGSATLDRLDKYFIFTQMPVGSSEYSTFRETLTTENDARDLETLKTLGVNMAKQLKEHD